MPTDTAKTKRIPRGALQLKGSPLEFVAGGESSTREAPIRMLARSAEPIEHWYWGRIVHDMAGMQLRKPTLHIDYCHDLEQIVGAAAEFNAEPKAGLTVAGKLVSVADGDRAAEIIDRGKAGVPYEASIDFHGPMRLEDVPEGMSADVNERTVSGPCTIVRQWTLNAVAVCPLGADPKTSTQFSADRPGDEVEIMLLAASAPSPAEPTRLTREEFEVKLDQFIAEFGVVNGSRWAAEGLTRTEALERHCDAMQEQIAALEKSNGANGEKTRQAVESKAATPTFKFAPHLARFAAAIKLPPSNPPKAS